MIYNHEYSNSSFLISDSLTMAHIRNSRTFTEHGENALVVLWMSTPRNDMIPEEWIFNGYNAHNQIRFRKEFPKTIGMCFDGEDRNDKLDFYELNEKGMTTVGKCVELRNETNQNSNVDCEMK